MSTACKVRIFGFVTRVNERGGRVAVPFGVYSLQELPSGHYQLSGPSLPTFALTADEVAAHMGAQMKVVEGDWP